MVDHLADEATKTFAVEKFFGGSGMGRRINHQNANQQQRILLNGHESVIDGSMSDGIGRGASRVFDVTSCSAGNEKVTVRRIAPGGGRRISPKSEEGRRIAAALLGGQDASPARKTQFPEAAALPNQKACRTKEPAARRPFRHEIMEASRQLQGIRPKRKKKKAKDKDLVGKIVGFNSTSERRGKTKDGTVSRTCENAAQPSVNIKKREKLRKLITAMFGPLLSLKRR